MKNFLPEFPSMRTPTLVSRDADLLKNFWITHRQVIFKPLEGMGGRSVFYVGDDGVNLSVILEVLTQSSAITIMAQKYIPEIHSHGDKRI